MRPNVLALAVAATPAAFAQCPPAWSALAPPGQGLNGAVLAAVEFDPDGPGPQESVIAVGGQTLRVIGGVAHHTVAWDGTAFQPLGGTLPYAVRSLAVFGGVLHAGLDAPIGSPSGNIYRLVGGAWQPLPSLRGPVLALAEYGGSLHAAGSFAGTTSNPQTRVIARWDGANWQPLGTGTFGPINALRVYNGRLFAGGGIQSFGGQPASYLGAWNGAAWSAITGGPAGPGVLCFAEFGGRLVAGGEWQSTNVPAGRMVLAWDDTSWSGYAPGLVSGVRVHAAAAFDGDLIVGGWGVVAGGSSVNNIARWHNNEWLPVGEEPWEGVTGPFVYAILPWRGDLYVFGSFNFAGSQPAQYAARWGAPHCCPDVNCDGVPDQGDVACMILAVAGDPGCFCQPDPDFNRDGVPDQGDVADVILVVAGAPCP